MDGLISKLDELVERVTTRVIDSDAGGEEEVLNNEVVEYLKSARVEVIQYKDTFMDKEKVVSFETNLMSLLCRGWRGVAYLSAEVSSPQYKIWLYGLQALSNTVTAFSSSRDKFLSKLTGDSMEFFEIVTSMVSSLPSVSINKLVEIFLVLVYNSCLDSFYRSQTLYTSSQGQSFLLSVLKAYPDMEPNTREICDEVIKNMSKEGLFREMFSASEDTAVLSGIQYEVLKTVCLSNCIGEFAQYFPTTISIFSRALHQTIELLKLSNNDPAMVESNSLKFQVFNEQLKLWLEWFYQISDPETEHGLVIRSNQELCLSLITLYISLINALHLYVPKIHTLKVANKITPSFLTLTGIMTCSIRALNNLIFQNTYAQDMVRELGGIPLILNQCNIDDNNPYLREHSIFAIRSLTIGNETNANLVKALAPKGPAFNPVLDEMGLKNNLDINGFPFLSQK